MDRLNLLPEAYLPNRSLMQRAADRCFGTHVVGIDIDVDAIRACHARWRGEHVEIIQVHDAALPPSTRRFGTLTDGDAFTRAAHQLYEKLIHGGMPARTRAVVGVRGHSTLFTRQFMIAAGLDDDAARSIIRQHVGAHLPKGLDNVWFGWERVQEVGIHDEDAVAFAAMSRDVAIYVQSAFRGSGFRVSCIEPTPWAMRRCARLRVGDPRGDAPTPATVCIDIGGTASTVVLLQGPRLLDTFDVLVGVDRYGTVVQQKLGVTAHAARETLESLLVGLGMEPDEVITKEVERTADEVARAIIAGIDEYLERLGMTREMGDVIGPYVSGEQLEAHPAIASLGDCLLSGSGARLQAFRSALGERLGLAPESLLFLPSDILERLKDVERTTFAAAIGHALRTEFTMYGWHAIMQRSVRTEDAAAHLRPSQISIPVRAIIPTGQELATVFEALAEAAAHEALTEERVAEVLGLITSNLQVGSRAFRASLARIAEECRRVSSPPLHWSMLLERNLTLPKGVAATLAHLRDNGGEDGEVARLQMCQRLAVLSGVAGDDRPTIAMT